MIFQATMQTRSKQLGANLSKDLQKKYGKKSARVVEGDSVTILRGEFKGVDGKVSKISTQKTSVAIEGVKKEKTKGDKLSSQLGLELFSFRKNLAPKTFAANRSIEQAAKLSKRNKIEIFTENLKN